MEIRNWQSGSVSSAIFFSVVVCFSLLTYQRNRIWQVELSLWKDVVIKAPLKARGQYNKGLAYYNEGRLDESIDQFQRAIKFDPNYTFAYNNLGLAYYNQGRLDVAIDQFLRAIKSDSKFKYAYNNLGLAYYSQGRLDESIDQFQRAITLKPDYVAAHYNLGLAYYGKGLIDESITAYKDALKYTSGFTRTSDIFDICLNLGNAYARKGLYLEAITRYGDASKIKPDDPTALNNLKTVQRMMRRGVPPGWEKRY